MRRRLTSTATSGDRERRAPLEHEARLERRPQDLHGRLAVATADRALVSACSALRPNILSVADAAQDVEEERAQPAQLEEASPADLTGALADQGQQKQEEWTGHEQDQPRSAVDHPHDAEDQERHEHGEQSRGLIGRRPQVDGLEAVHDDARQLATVLTARMDGAEHEQASGEVATQGAGQPVRAPVARRARRRTARTRRCTRINDQRDEERPDLPPATVTLEERLATTSLRTSAPATTSAAAPRPAAPQTHPPSAARVVGEQPPFRGRVASSGWTHRGACRPTVGGLVALGLDDRPGPGRGSTRRPCRAG